MFNRSYNRHHVIGRLGKDPDVRYSPNGDPIANLSVATSETWKDKNSGEKQEKTEWHRVVIFGKRAELVGKHFRKGDLVSVIGKSQTRKWQDRDGNDRYNTEIVLSQFVGDIEMLQKSDSSNRGSIAEQGEPAAPSQAAEDFDDDIPF